MIYQLFVLPLHHELRTENTGLQRLFPHVLPHLGSRSTEDYVLDVLKMQDRVSEKFVKYIKDGLYEIRASYNGNIYRAFFIFDEGNIVMLFNGFQKKTQKTPSKEIDRALELKKEYYAGKK